MRHFHQRQDIIGGTTALDASPNVGGVAEVADVLSKAPLCWRCACAKANVPVERFDEALVQLRATFVVALRLAPCDGCGTDTLLYRIG